MTLKQAQRLRRFLLAKGIDCSVDGHSLDTRDVGVYQIGASLDRTSLVWRECGWQWARRKKWKLVLGRHPRPECHWGSLREVLPVLQARFAQALLRGAP